MIAALSLYDSSFNQQAFKRLIISCLQARPVPTPVTVCQTGHLSSKQFIVSVALPPPEGQTGTGVNLPADPRLSRAAISALAALLTDCNDREIEIIRNRPEVQAVIAMDLERADQASTEWRANLQQIVKKI